LSKLLGKGTTGENMPSRLCSLANVILGKVPGKLDHLDEPTRMARGADLRGGGKRGTTRRAPRIMPEPAQNRYGG
jgi:hypothetical protein